MNSTKEVLENLPLGFRFKTVIVSNSMVPTFQKNDLLIIEINSFSDIKINDIVVFKSTAPDNLIIHRVIKIIKDNKRKLKIITKGDANPTEDKTPLKKSNYIGKAIKIIKQS
jgi:signal peptidase I